MTIRYILCHLTKFKGKALLYKFGWFELVLRQGFSVASSHDRLQTHSDPPPSASQLLELQVFTFMINSRQFLYVCMLNGCPYILTQLKVLLLTSTFFDMNTSKIIFPSKMHDILNSNEIGLLLSFFFLFIVCFWFLLHSFCVFLNC